MMQVPFLLASSIQNYVTSPYGIWFPVVIVATVAVISVLAMIYMFSLFSGRREVSVWARIKIFEVLLSLILIFIFLFLVGFLFSLNFQSLYGFAGLLPNACQPATLQATDLFSVALCNMYQFNNNVLSFNTWIYYLGLRESFIPKIHIDAGAFINAITGIPGLGGDIKLEPSSGFETMVGFALDLLYTMFLISQVQLLLLASSLLFFSLFMSLGLISRIFVVTRGFAGAMIALAVGLGIIYPLLVSFSYGFVNTQLDQYQSVFSQASFLTAFGGITAMFAGFIFGGLTGLVPGSPFTIWLTGFLKFAGFAVVGLTIIPFMNFIVLDVFIKDFSEAIGQQTGFLSLLTKII